MFKKFTDKQLRIMYKSLEDRSTTLTRKINKLPSTITTELHGELLDNDSLRLLVHQEKLFRAKKNSLH